MLAWFAMTYLTFIPAALFAHRIMYIFYFLSTLPSICIAVPYMIIDQKPPRMIVVIYFAAVIGGFISLFPFRVVP
jgi:hypothetical protein